MHTEIYSDGIGEITVTGNVLRIDLVSLSPTERDANNTPKATFRQRIIMPLDGFANAADLIQKVMQGLIEAGAIQRRPTPEAAAPAGTGPVPAPNGAHRNSSPNFV
ncbi:hypothetical protein [Inquilinus sp.]|jgi:hypothetical protein|uniref:hypothetical protein n=1 Tax=Inquilinus sp. TaxID=1932117 RepID=UPI0037832F7C